MTVTRRISVISTTVVKTGVSAGGSPWTLYEVVATDEQGAPIEEKLKSFEKLEGTVEVEVERQEHPKYGVSYTLKPVGGAAEAPSPGARLGPKVDELRERIETLERRLAETNTVVTTLVERANTAGGDLYAPAPAPAPAPEPEPEPGGATF